ncbi:glycosyltransferase family 2 protein [Jannaschia sp. W003]|uniref:glycosyltransferase n=1 Tax=Jannaschia sp. W003 TaxID=2867012 RepID=UPI0021A40388|nr:glycosyltransferase [Jannaschia sp. W003]UWQ19966.1 glycosyltransferase [Jannaschia sp. W003]
MIAAVVPARDEAERIGAAVAALRHEGARVLVVANACTDDTAEVARRGGAAVLETPALPGGVGEARAVGCAAALQRWPAASMLATSDADCRVAPGALAALARALILADAAAGRVVPDPLEFAALPDAVRRHGDLEDLRDALLAEIGARAVPVPHDPAPRHGQAPGALLAFRPAAYRAVGGFAPLRCSEDRDIVRRLCVAGLRVAHPWDAVVLASCRLEGRAPGGMADTIAHRAASDLAPETARLEVQCTRLARFAEALRAEGPRAAERLAALVADPVPSALVA